MYEEGNNAYCFSVLIIAALYVLYCFNYIPHKKYTNADFNIEAYKSNIDKDNDGIDDQTDILNNANNYIKTNPKYKSKYYNTGYPDDEYGVCTDVVAFALKDAGYDLMVLVNEDIKNNKELYDIDAVDKNIDFRRVKNLKVYFDNNAISLTTEINEIEEWQGGDIVVLKNISALYLTREIEKVYVLLSIMQIHIKYIMKRIYWNIVMIS